MKVILRWEQLSFECECNPRQNQVELGNRTKGVCTRIEFVSERKLLSNRMGGSPTDFLSILSRKFGVEMK